MIGHVEGTSNPREKPFSFPQRFGYKTAPNGGRTVPAFPNIWVFSDDTSGPLKWGVQLVWNASTPLKKNPCMECIHIYGVGFHKLYFNDQKEWKKNWVGRPKMPHFPCFCHYYFWLIVFLSVTPFKGCSSAGTALLAKEEHILPYPKDWMDLQWVCAKHQERWGPYSASWSLIRWEPLDIGTT